MDKKTNITKPKVTPSEMFLTGILLAFTGGFLDAYTYILRGNVFANAQTGNIVLLGINIATGDIKKALYYLIPILAFAVGIFLTEIIKRNFSEKKLLHWRQIIILFEIIILFIIGLSDENIPNSFINVSVSFVCALQVASFRKLSGLGYATTMCTGNLRSSVDKLSLFLFEKDKKALIDSILYMSIIILFIAGAATGVILIKHFSHNSIWLCCILLLFVLIILHEEE